MTERTSKQIRAYCEAALAAPWEPICIDDFADLDELVAYVETMVRQGGIELYYGVMKKGGGEACTVMTGNGSTSGNNLLFACYARTDLPRVLEAAENWRDVGTALLEIAQKVDRWTLLDLDIPFSRAEMRQLGDTLMAAGKLLAETAWLEEDTDGST